MQDTAAGRDATSEVAAQEVKKPGKLSWHYWKYKIGLAVLAVLGWVAQDMYGAARDYMLGPDEFLVQLAETQKKEFADLKVGLSQLRGGSSSEERAALKNVQEGVASLERNNRDLLAKLTLAKRENETLSQAAASRGGAQGGYDLLLSEGQGLRLDDRNVLGVRRIGSASVDVSLSSLDEAQPRNANLRSGQSLAYRNAAGRDCQVSLLSLDPTGKGAASFARNCG